ncbi:alpha/beta hydrolase [Halorhodospira halochloris]|uniref:alpha/beta hydrolase n=1 Tax=Halorhodospira halochloris TaxID=1052 RepID=UPI001EE88C98|nr:alpha/beta hydrolase [Halorhodospira halochloris]MCG5530476.1 alpha/beta hydrolase [Halorhodospira halochloris]
MGSRLPRENRISGSDGLTLEFIGEPARQPSAPRRAPLLFVHGAFSGAWVWQDNYLPYFAGLGFDAFALSLRGHGASEGRDRLAITTLKDYVNDLKSVAAQFERPPILIGHSMGGLVVDMALRSRVNASAAVLLAAVPPTGMGPAAMRTMLSDPAMIWQMFLLQSMGPSWVDPQCVQRAIFADPPERELVLEYFGQSQSESQLALSELAIPYWPCSSLGQVPVGVVGAEKDAIVLPWMVSTTAWFHGVEPYWIPGAGHATMLEDGWIHGAEIVTKCLGTLG